MTCSRKQTNMTDSGYNSVPPILKVDAKAGGKRSDTYIEYKSYDNKYHKQILTQSEMTIPDITFEDHYKQLIEEKPHSLTWGCKDFERLSDLQKSFARKLLWDSRDEDGDCEAFKHAREGNDSAVIYSVYMAESVQRLIQRNLDLQTILHVAAETCKASTVRVLVTRGCDGALADIWGNTPLHIAAKHGRADVIKALTTSIKKEELSHPCFKVPYKSLPQDNKDQMNHDGNTPLHLAAQRGHAECIKALADCKVDMDCRRLGDGYAALHIVIDLGDIVCMRALLEGGADLEVRNYKAETPQQLSFLVKRQDMVALCAEFGASPNQLLFAETEQIELSSHFRMVDDIEYNRLAKKLQKIAWS